MKPHIDFNTQKRAISNNEADNNFFKLMNIQYTVKQWKI